MLTISIVVFFGLIAFYVLLDKKQFRPTDIVVINLSGRGDKDLSTYIDYFNLH